MSFITTFSSSLSIDLKRHLRSPALLFFALAAPVAAHYMVPDQEATYAVLSVNNLIPVLTAPVLGLELGVLAATLLTPLAYIFLRAGPTPRRPWQITDVSPHSRAAWGLGRWVADTLTLWMLLTALTCAGLILGVFRIEGDAAIFQTVVSLWLPAAPSLALIAAIRLFLDSRSLTRRWFGDTVFFVLWIALLITSMIGTTDPTTSQMTNSPMTDVFGFVSPILGSVDYPVDAVAIGGSANTGESIQIDAWRGVTNTGYITARLFWLAAAAGLAVVAGLIWAPMKVRAPKAGETQLSRSAAKAASIPNTPFSAPSTVASGSTKYGAAIFSEIKLMFRNRIWILAILAAAVTGAVFPFRSVAGPVLFLVLIFPFTEASARWQGQTTEPFLDTLGPGRIGRAVILLFASTFIALIAMLPTVVLVILRSELQWLSHILLISIAVPAIIVLLGAVTRSAVTGRLLMLSAWYVYLSSAA